MRKFKTAIIGLGNIGFQFNLDSLRKGVWSHAAAYDICRQTKLCAAVEIDRKKVAQFNAYYKGRIPVFLTIKELMQNTRPDIVSICTPAKTHYAILKELAQYPLKAIFCEKPIALSLKEAKEMVALCRKKRILLAVNHSRRWENGYLSAKKIISDGKIGEVKMVNGLYPAQVFNIGTHLLDIIRFLISKDPEVASGVSIDSDNADPDVSGYLIFQGGVTCTINAIGKRENLIFEVDIIGSKGRIRISENGRKIDSAVFVKSPNYSGYKELFLRPVKLIAGKDRFVQAMDDIVKVLTKKKPFVNCSGNDGLIALKMSYAMFDSAKNRGLPLIRVGV